MRRTYLALSRPTFFLHSCDFFGVDERVSGALDVRALPAFGSCIEPTFQLCESCSIICVHGWTESDGD